MRRARAIPRFGAASVLCLSVAGCWFQGDDFEVARIVNATDVAIAVYVDEAGRESLFATLSAGDATRLATGDGCNQLDMVARTEDGREVDSMAAGDLCTDETWEIQDD